ncbi:MAG: TIGR03960 family B12-binding radical SAM protein [Firmicutes bacterium]|nr:TIGR03960 family B12-binding radical SAM protein [Bacillota bacterium]
MKNYRQIFREKILPRLQKPTRYLGNEINAVIKEDKPLQIKVALAFPDLYEIGMSHLGLKILYHLINENDDWSAERVFMPAPDLEAILQEENFPLCSLETVTPLSLFDLVGFTLQYELSYATVLQMLSLGGIPLTAEERNEGDPLVVGGGPCAFNPEPLVDFFDFFILGDAEELLPQVLEILQKHKALPRKEKLLRLAAVKGVYVPAFYEAQYGKQGEYLGTVAKTEAVPKTVQRAVVANLDQAFYPIDFIVPYGSIVHDRLVLEIFRGCTRGCRFCQAGIIYRPVRERKPETLRELALKMVRATGYEEIALSSLSSGDYSAIDQLVRGLNKDLAREGVSLSLPSLRLDSFATGLAEQVQRVRKSGLTFAPEAGTQRLRDVINKNITEEDLLIAVKDAFANGWTAVKLYFMMGLPTETDEDLLGIADLAKKVVSAYKEVGGKGKPRVTVSVSIFVPKPHTPFQWFGQITEEEILRRQSVLKKALRIPGVQFQYHDAQTSILEAALARGGRELAPVIKRAAELGCRLDGWEEHFSYSAWQQAFGEVGLELAAAAQKQFAADEPLPWDHLDTGVSKRYLWREYQKALASEATEDCRQGCLGCGMALLLKEEEEKGVCSNASLD